MIRNKTRRYAILAVALAAIVLMPMRVAADDYDFSELRPFPDWVTAQPFPDWLFMVDEIPDWFFDLPAEPIWYWQIERIPAWFFTITEIPDWFFAVYEEPEDDYPEPYDDEAYRQEQGDGADTPPLPDEALPHWFTDFFDDINQPRVYTYTLWDGSTLYSSVPRGIITNDEVIISYPYDRLYLTRDGWFLAHTPGASLTEHGFYELIALGTDNVIFSFTLVTRPVNDIDVFSLPDDFILVSVTRSGIALPIPDATRFNMDEDGVYEFIFSCPDFEVIYEVTLVRDTTPPALTFFRETETGREALSFETDDDAFAGPVVMEIYGDGEYTVQVLLNRAVITPRRRFVEAGRYHITVTDTAGNYTEVSFRVLYVMDIPTIWIIVIVSLSFVILVFYLYRNRTKIRVR